MLGLLSLFPHSGQAGGHVGWLVVGVAGWNTSATGLNVRPLVGCGLGTLLGPEETPAWCRVFLVPLLAWLSNGSCVELVAMVGWGVVVC